MLDAHQIDATEQRLITWIEKNLSGKVTSIDRQQRWRPCWFVKVHTKDGRDLSLYVRGDRTSRSIPAPFEQEYHIMRVLEAEGLNVPHLYGLCPDPSSIVMDLAPGQADLSTAASDADRRAVMEQYMSALARIHSLDVAKFAAIGMRLPVGARDIGHSQFDDYETMYRKGKKRPEPLMEYLIRWVRRNVPMHRDKVSFVCSDVAQFMFSGNKLTALLDFEMSYLGDSIQDLAALQLRDTWEPLGDVPAALRHYEKVTGAPIDGDAFDFHAISFAAITPISMTENIATVVPMGSVLQYLEWWINFCRVPLELIAARAKWSLPMPAPLKSEPSFYAPQAESLVGAIKAVPIEATSFATFERDAAAGLAGFMARVGEYGASAARADLAETEELLGAKFDSWQAGDAALEAFVLKAGADQDARLVPLFYRRIQRQWDLLTPFLSRPSVAGRLKTFSELMGR
jgi:aminoglycoside phosphotransferase (APT) family kinase protein